MPYPQLPSVPCPETQGTVPYLMRQPLLHTWVKHKALFSCQCVTQFYTQTQGSVQLSMCLPVLHTNTRLCTAVNVSPSSTRKHKALYSCQCVSQFYTQTQGPIQLSMCLPVLHTNTRPCTADNVTRTSTHKHKALYGCQCVTQYRTFMQLYVLWDVQPCTLVTRYGAKGQLLPPSPGFMHQEELTLECT